MDSNRIGRGFFFAALIVMIQLTFIKTSNAALSIEFLISDVSPTASIYYDPNGDAKLNGTNLVVTGVKGVETALNSGVTLPIYNGTLTFQTGTFTSKTGSSIGNVWNFGSSGEITLRGGMSAFGIPDNGTIYKGIFTSASLLQIPLGPYQFDIFSAAMEGAEIQNIDEYFGVSTDTPLADAVNFSFIGANKSGGFTSTNFTGGVMVEDPITTPIPAALWLLVSGLLGLSGIRRSMKLCSFLT